MKTMIGARLRFKLLFSSLTLLVVALAYLAGTPAHASGSTGGYRPNLTNIVPLWQQAVKISSLHNAGAGTGSNVLACQSSVTVPRCYGPQQIWRAYGIQPLLDKGITGKGHTIVIIDAYQAPNIASDLKVFDKLFSLPDPKLNIIAPFGLTPFNPGDINALSFSLEITLDVEWAHAIAPDATIDLVLANIPAQATTEQQAVSLLQVANYAIEQNLGDVITQSFGTGETCLSAAFRASEQAVFKEAAEKKITVLASSGDTGSVAPLCKGQQVTAGVGVNLPAADPWVTAVGGTTLTATTDGAYTSESVWNEGLGGSGGGGFSVLAQRPSYQDGIKGIGAYRGLPDVSYNADDLTGVPIVYTLGAETLIVPIGGTSAGSPQWAGLVVLFNQVRGKRIGFLNPVLYKIYKTEDYSESFHDITVGNNALSFVFQKKTYSFPGYNATTGWDAASGLGTPKAQALSELLKKY